MPAVRFVVAPFLPEIQPALGVSSLQAVLRDAGISADISYLNADYRERAGADLYEFLSHTLPSQYQLGELLFSVALWGEEAPGWTACELRLRDSFADVPRVLLPGMSADDLARRQLDRWEDSADAIRLLHDTGADIVRTWADEILRDDPGVVGFTTTFQQNIASLALAKELRSRRSSAELRILFGGANCEADMGLALAENFAFIDHVVSGEAEGVIVDLVGEAGRSMPRFIVGPMVQDMDTLPVPDFDDYFEAIAGTDLESKAALSAESSRGCWWGVKSHCTFCGLNGTTMAFRSKDPDRFADELHTQVRRYGDRGFLITDNILDLGYIQTLFPRLIVDGKKLVMFYETKSNLRKDNLELMAAGGIAKIQPGIESLSSPILQLMAKGTTRLQNVQLLKWCEEFGVGVMWNFLYGFPGEDPAEYDDMVELLPRLVHLPPPLGCARIRLDRFGPYWNDPEAHGIENVRPYWAYDMSYSGLPAAQRSRVAYFFEYDYADGRDPDSYAARLLDAGHAWTDAYDGRDTKAVLEVEEREGAWVVVDSRCSEEAEVHTIDLTARALLRVFDAACNRRTALARWNHVLPAEQGLDASALDALIDELTDRDWLIEEAGKVLSLVVDRSERARLERRRLSIQLADIGFPQLAEPVSAPTGVDS